MYIIQCGYLFWTGACWSPKPSHAKRYHQERHAQKTAQDFSGNLLIYKDR